MQYVQKDAIGVEIKLTITENRAALDLSACITLNLIFKKPGGGRVEKPAAFVTDGTNGKLKYVTESGFLDRTGIWRIQAFLKCPDGSYRGRGAVGEFQVKDNL